jgi:hypothetical protein
MDFENNLQLITVVYPGIGKKVPNNYFNVSRILGRAAIKFEKN